MKNICILRKYVFILALSVSAIVTAFAQGAVIGYADGRTWIDVKGQYAYTGFPTNAQLQKLTHVIASDIGCYTHTVNKQYTGLWVGRLPNKWEGNINLPGVWNRTTKNLWLQSLVSRAHAEGVIVSICVGGGEDQNFRTATNGTNLQSFVNDIVSFVNLHGIDGVDIDWEWPGRDTNDADEWDQCFKLLNALKNHSQLSGKRISIALTGSPNNSRYTNTTALNQIWNKVDAVYLMTYDEGWQTHSRADNSISVINSWADWGTSGGRNLDKKKLYVGCAFYGYKKDSNGNTLWGEANKVNYATYSGGGNYNPGDNTTDVQTKVRHCLNNEYGGVFIWELGYDLPATNYRSLLSAIRAAYPTISGPDSFCPSGVFSVSGTNSTVTWEVNDNFTVSYPDSKSIKIERTNSSQSTSGTVTARVNALTLSKSFIACPSLDNLYITGPKRICSDSEATYTIPDLPVGATVTWSSTGGIELQSSNGTTSNEAVFKAIWDGCCEGIEARVETPFSYKILYYNVDDVRSVSPMSIDAPSYIRTGATAIFEVKLDDWEASFKVSDNFMWKIVQSSYWGADELFAAYPELLDPQNSDSWYSTYHNRFDYTFSGGGNHVILCKIINECGIQVPVYGELYVNYGSYYYSAYPNPASSILNIDLDQPAISQAKASMQTTTDGKQLKREKAYDIRLYDNQGNMLRQRKAKGGKVEFNVASLPNGIYYLHIYDGVNEKPEMRQIVVQH